MERLEKLEKTIGLFILKMREKKQQIHDDDFYGVKSPLQMPSAFSKNNKQKIIT